MKKTLLPALLVLSLSVMISVSLGGSVITFKYASALSALGTAMKGNQQGFADLIDLAKNEMGKFDLTLLTISHIDKIISFAQTAMQDGDVQVRTAAKSFVDKLKPKIEGMTNQNPAELLPLLRKLNGLTGSDKGIPLLRI